MEKQLRELVLELDRLADYAHNVGGGDPEVGIQPGAVKRISKAMLALLADTRPEPPAEAPPIEPIARRKWNTEHKAALAAASPVSPLSEEQVENAIMNAPAGDDYFLDVAKLLNAALGAVEGQREKLEPSGVYASKSDEPSAQSVDGSFPEITMSTGAPAGCTAQALEQMNNWIEVGAPTAESDAYEYDAPARRRSRDLVTVVMSVVSGAPADNLPDDCAAIVKHWLEGLNVSIKPCGTSEAGKGQAAPPDLESLWHKAKEIENLSINAWLDPKNAEYIFTQIKFRALAIQAAIAVAQQKEKSA